VEELQTYALSETAQIAVVNVNRDRPNRGRQRQPRKGLGAELAIVDRIGVGGREVDGVDVVVSGHPTASWDMSVVGDEVNIEDQLTQAVKSDVPLLVKGEDLDGD
jgi:hypothetical protein